VKEPFGIRSGLSRALRHAIARSGEELLDGEMKVIAEQAELQADRCRRFAEPRS
jgi:hypothetical protein